MKIEKLRLKGFIGIKRGLGLDEITIDFSNITGLTAFSGQNGLGKSTVLENMHPFNTLASRSGALFNHVFLRDSEKELTFAYNGHSYRTLLKIDAQSNKSEGFIWKDKKSEVNGKISAYAKYMTELLGSENLFFNSVFCAQNATKLSDMRTGELKALFAEFLRLDRLQANEDTCKQIITKLSGRLSQVEIDLEVIRKRLDGAQAHKTELERLVALKYEQEANRDELREKLAGLQKEREGLKEVIARNEVLIKQVDQLKTALADMESNKKAEETAVNATLSSLRAKYKNLTMEIADADSILAKEADILAAAEKEKEITTLISGLTIEIDDLSTDINKRNSDIYQSEIIIKDIRAEIAKLANDADAKEIDDETLKIDKELTQLSDRFKVLLNDEAVLLLKKDISFYESSLSALEGIDKDCKSEICQLAINAQKSGQLRADAINKLIEREKYVDDQLSIIAGNVKTLEKSKTENLEKRNVRIAELADIGEKLEKEGKATDVVIKSGKICVRQVEELVATKRKSLATARFELTKYQDLAAKQSEIAVAKSQKADRGKALEENKQRGLTITADWGTRAAALDDQITSQHLKINEIEGQINPAAQIRLNKIVLIINSAEVDIKEIESVKLDTDKQIAKAQAELSGMQEAEEQLEKKIEDKDRIVTDISEWTYLRNACGKNGLQALEIDGAAPLITGYANDLLSRAFGALYSVKFRTQDDEGKECLDIIVIPEDGEEILLDNLSGGQKIWSLMALREAMTLLSKEKGGRPFESAFFDEIDGALDPDNAVNFINMYRAFMEIGKFEDVFFISHKPECRSMADHVLMFEAGKNPVWQ